MFSQGNFVTLLYHWFYCVCRYLGSFLSVDWPSFLAWVYDRRLEYEYPLSIDDGFQVIAPPENIEVISRIMIYVSLRSIQDQRWSPGEDDIESPAYWRIVNMFTKDTEPKLRRMLTLENCFLVANVVLEHCL